MSIDQPQPRSVFQIADAAAWKWNRVKRLRRAFLYIANHRDSRRTKDQEYHKSSVILPAKEYLVRNRDIVDSVEQMIVVPFETEEIIRSGTWMTYRYAKKQNVTRTLILPDGQMRVEKSTINTLFG